MDKLEIEEDCILEVKREGDPIVDLNLEEDEDAEVDYNVKIEAHNTQSYSQLLDSTSDEDEDVVDEQDIKRNKEVILEDEVSPMQKELLICDASFIALNTESDCDKESENCIKDAEFKTEKEFGNDEKKSKDCESEVEPLDFVSDSSGKRLSKILHAEIIVNPALKSNMAVTGSVDDFQHKSLENKKAIKLSIGKQTAHKMYNEQVLAAYDIIDRKELKEICSPFTERTHFSFFGFTTRVKRVFSQDSQVQQPVETAQKRVSHDKAVIKLSIEKTADGEQMQVITLSHMNKPNADEVDSNVIIFDDDGTVIPDENEENYSDAESDRSSNFNEEDDSFAVEDIDSTYVVTEKSAELPDVKDDSTMKANEASSKLFRRDVKKAPTRRITLGATEIKNTASDIIFRHTLPFVGSSDGKKIKKKTLPLEPFLMMTDGYPVTIPSFPSDRRSLIALEVYTTERSFVRGLEIVVSLFMKQIELNNLLDAKEMQLVFSNIPNILELNKDIMDELYERISKWSDDQCIGDIFVLQQEKLKIYADYCKNYDASEIFLKQKLKKKKELQTCLQTCYSNRVCLPGLTLSSYLITVIQRIPRYILLLRDLLKKTPKDHPDHNNLTCAQVLMEKIATYLNDQLKQAQCAKALELLQTQITGLRAYYTPERNLVHEGSVCLQTSKKTYQCVLFNDLLVFAVKGNTKTSAVELSFALQTVWIEDLENLDPQTTKSDAIAISNPDRSYTMYVGSAGEKKIWLTHLSKAITQHLYGVEVNSDIDLSLRTTSYTYNNGAVYSGTYLDAKKHGEGTLMCPNQMTYMGNWEDDEMNGFGVLEYVTGEIYEGLWKDNRQDGLGTFKYSNGDSISGDWKNGRRHGKAVMNYANGDHFDGNFVNDRIDGYGEFTTKYGMQYLGHWRRNLKHGQGKLKNSDGTEYSGGFARGKYHGEGSLIYSDGSMYNGEFERGERCGQGSYTVPGGMTYEGQWLHDMKDGEGKMLYENGDEYNGIWYQDMRFGKGVMFYNYGSYYRGEWQDDLKHGTGVMQNKDGNRYEGDWRNNQMSGSGTMSYRGGDIFKGSWKDNVPNGRGVLSKSSGWLCEGNWVQGKQDGECKLEDPVNEYKFVGVWSNGMREGKGVEITMKSTYEGEFVENLRDGYGVEKFSNGIVYEGHWCQGQKHGLGTKRLINGLLESQSWHYGLLVKSPVLLTAVEMPALQCQ